MDFHLSEMQQLIVHTARRFVAAHTDLDQWRQRRDLIDGVNSKLWRAMADLGWMAMAVPEDTGGLASPMEDIALLMIELGKGNVTEPVVSTAIIASHILNRTMTGEARIEWLGRIADGSVRVALAQSDPMASELAPVTAVAGDGGITLNGHSFMVFDAPSADHFVVLVQMDAAPALFLLDAKTAGIEANIYPLIDGSRAADLTFANVDVPATALLSKGTEALAVLHAALDRARVALVAQSVGAMEAAIQVTINYAREREQFGQSIGKFQAIQHMATDMFVAAYQARSALYAALRDLDADALTRSSTVSMAKLVSGLSGQIVARNGIQIHGGYGITDEYAISHYYRRLFVLEKQYGAIEDHAGLLAAVEVKTAETVSI